MKKHEPRFDRILITRKRAAAREDHLVRYATLLTSKLRSSEFLVLLITEMYMVYMVFPACDVRVCSHRPEVGALKKLSASGECLALYLYR